MGGTPKRMEQFANYIMKEIGHKLPAGTTLLDISQYSYRYSMYKVGPVLSISVSIHNIIFDLKNICIHILLTINILLDLLIFYYFLLYKFKVEIWKTCKYQINTK